jgi:hypothetical protein
VQWGYHTLSYPFIISGEISTMSKTNTKASSTQIAESVAAEQEVKTATSAPAQDTSGVSDTSTDKPVADASETDVAAQEAAAASGTESKEADLTVTPVATPAPTEAPTPAPTQAPKIAVVEAPKPVVANASNAERLAKILSNVPSANQIDISRVQAYIERMSPKRPIDAKVGTAEQVALYRAIQNIVNRQEEFFHPLFTALLFLFQTEGRDGALSDRFRMRFMDNVSLPVGDRKAFANITQMLHILADPKSRSLAMKQVSMERALENGLTAEGRDRVLSYFGA